MHKIFYLLSCLCLCAPSYADGVRLLKQEKGKITFSLKKETLSIYPLAENAVRVIKQREFTHHTPELIYTPVSSYPRYELGKNDSCYVISLEKLRMEVTVSDGKLRFFSADGKAITHETACSLKASSVQQEKTYVAQQSFFSPEDEYQIGLGQFQDGYLNVRSLSRRLTQVNTQIAIPFVLSNKGYGLLWNNYGLTEFNPSDNCISLKRSLKEGEKVTVNVTFTKGGVKETRENNFFTGQLNIHSKGHYALLLDVGSVMARRHHLTIDKRTVIDMDNLWLPPTASVIVELDKGIHSVEAKLNKEDNPRIFYRKIDDTTTFRSPVSNGIDYTFFAGTPDEIISAFRNVSGTIPMLPSWAMGYIHCRERFSSQAQLLETARKFRKENLPVDLIVQDWQYWGKYGWNAMRFDETSYPSPKAMVDSLHALDMRLMLSVWSKIDQNSVLGKQMAEKGYYIPQTPWVDFFNAEAASFYWQNFRDSLISPIGIDAWWLDATEPENDDLVGRRINHSQLPGEVLRNAYPLMVNKTVYEGIRREDKSGKRTMILTRSAFPGIQRYGVATWSGDVGNDWDTFKRQIAGGLGISVCGLPWWTYDAGGFFRPGKSQYTDPDFHERFLRWLQTSVYLPLMRVHGYMTDTEFWNYGEKVTALARKSLADRYLLLPYIYSEAAAITFKNSTMMRPLLMDYPTDTTALSLNCQYMFGKSLLIAPIVEKGPSSWRVYLPKVKGGWYDFYSHRTVGTGWYKAPVSIEHIPVFVKAGSILPLACHTQSTAKALNNDLEIRIYTGNNGSYQLYEDEGVNYNYEIGKYATYDLSWNDTASTFHISDRKGSYEGMNPHKHIKLIKIDSDAEGNIKESVKEIEYHGKQMSIVL